MLRAWQPGTPLVCFWEAVRERERGALAAARLPGEARSPGPAELAGRARSGLAAEAWGEPPGRVRADGHPSARGRSLPPGSATSRTHPVHQDIDIFHSNLFKNVLDMQKKWEDFSVVQWMFTSSLSRICNSHFVWEALVTRAILVP